MAGVAVLRAPRVLLPRTLVVVSGRCSVPVESFLPPAPCVFPPLWQVRTLQLCSAMCAGHNKWSKVKHIKGPKDEARGKLITKFAMLIRIAVKEGGSNPELNLNLAHLLEQCKSKNLPKATIENAIKRAEKAKPATQHVVEARGPGGCLLLIEVLTDNNARTTAEIRRLLNKNGGVLSDGVRHNFNRSGVVVVADKSISTERALELAIEVGAEDVQEAEDEEEQPILKFICNSMDLIKVRRSLEGLGMKTESSEVEFIPTNFTTLDQDEMNAASTLIDALSDFPDVVRVWDNVQADG